jgi:hypothetical protein
MLSLKNNNLFQQQKFPQSAYTLFRRYMQPNRITKREYEGKMYLMLEY